MKDICKTVNEIRSQPVKNVDKIIPEYQREVIRCHLHPWCTFSDSTGYVTQRDAWIPSEQYDMAKKASRAIFNRQKVEVMLYNDSAGVPTVIYFTIHPKIEKTTAKEQGKEYKALGGNY